MSLALLFPGQGSQYVGMAAALAEREAAAAKILRTADEILDFPLSRLMAEGPEEELTSTDNAQAALLTHSVAALRVLGDRLGRPAFAAGHSLGELSAHVAAGTLAFEDALRAVRVRGRLMHEAGVERPGTMAAVLGLDDEAVAAVCDRVDEGVCVPANYNSPGQVVVSGDVEGVSQAMELVREAGAKRVVRLNVSGAFHSPLMEAAAEGFRTHLETIRFFEPDYPVVSATTARAVQEAEVIRELLVAQLTSPVRWSAAVTAMVDGGVDHFLELGSGRVLTMLNRRNARGVRSSYAGEPDDFERLEAR